MWVDNVSADQDGGKGLFARIRCGGTGCWPDPAPRPPVTAPVAFSVAAPAAAAGDGAVGGADTLARKR
jgi:hypothetical protein